MYSTTAQSIINNRKSPETSQIVRQTEIGEMKLNVLWSKLIIKQVKQILPSFIEFSAITDSNLCFSTHKNFAPFFSFLFYLVIVCFSLFTDLSQFWSANDTLKKISEQISSFVHIPPTIDPTYIFSTPPFLIIIIFFLYSFGGYFSIFIHKYKNYFCHREMYEAALFLTESISLTIFVYEIGNIPIHIIHCISLPDQCKIVYGTLVIISIASLPYLFLVISRTFSDVKISGFPFLSANCLGAFKQIFSISFICSIIPIFCNITNKYRLWLFLFIVVISIRNIYASLFFPSFLQPATRVFVFSATLILFFNSIIAYILTFFNKPLNYLPPTLFISVNIVCPVLSYLYYRFANIKLRSMLISYQHEISKLSDETIFLMYACYDSTTYPILSSIDFVKQVHDKYPYSDPLLVLSLRFLYSSKKHPNYIFQRAAFLFRSSMYNVLGSLRLATLIELSNELMLSDHYLSSMRLNRLDMIISECVEAHVIFWEAVLLDRMPAICEAAFLLYDKVQNASEYFKFLKIDDNSPQEYSRLYKKFKNRISIESSYCDDIIGFVGNMKKLSSDLNVSLKGISSSPNYSELMKNVLVVHKNHNNKEEEVQNEKEEKKQKHTSPNLPMKRLRSTPIIEGLSTNMLSSNLAVQGKKDTAEQTENDTDKQVENNKNEQKEIDKDENLKITSTRKRNRGSIKFGQIPVPPISNRFNNTEKNKDTNNDNQDTENNNQDKNIDKNQDKGNHKNPRPKREFDENFIKKSLIMKGYKESESQKEDESELNHPSVRKKITHFQKPRHRSDYDTYVRLIRADSIDFSPDKGPIAETVKNYEIDGQAMRNNLFKIFFISAILSFFGILITVSIKYSQFTKLMHESLDYFNANCALFRSSYRTIFTLIINKNDLSDNFFFVYDKLINQFNKEKAFHTIESSRSILRESSRTIYKDLERKDEMAFNSLFDNYAKIIKNNYTNMKELIISDDFLQTTSLLTEIGTDLILKDFNQTKKILDKTADYNQFIRKIYKIIGIISLIELPILLILCINTYYVHLNIFLQPPLIKKVDVRNVFQYYVSESKAYQKVGNRAQIEKEKKDFLQRKKNTRLFNTVFILFASFILIIAATVVLIYLFTILFNNFTDALQVIEYTSFSCIPYIKSIYQLMAISEHSDKPKRLYQSLVSNFIIISQFINQPHKKFYGNKNNSFDDVKSTLNDYSNFICIEPSFIVDFNDQKHLLQLNSFYIFGRQLSYKYLSTLKLVHFKLIESIKIICNHPEDYSIAMLIPHEWFNIGAIFEQYFDEIYLQYKSEIITIKSEYFVFVTLAIIVEIILFVISINDISYLTKSMHFITKILAILPNHSPFFNDDTKEIVFRKDTPNIDIMPLLDIMPISFITVDKNGAVIDRNVYAQKLFKKAVAKGAIFKPIREFVDKSGDKHYFRIIYSLAKNFPYHPYSSPFNDALYYILVQDITSTANKKKKINYLTQDLNEYRNYIFPAYLNVSSSGPKSVFLLDNFAIVEIVFTKEMEKESFQEFITKFNEMNNKFYSAFLSDDQRCSFFVIFSSFNQNVKQKQHLRDAIKCSQYFYETFRSYNNLDLIKIAVSHGEKSICKLIESTSTYIEVFSNSLIKSAQMLKFCFPGEVICELDILSSIYEVDSNQGRYGYFDFNGDQINFKVFENGFSFINSNRSSFLMSGNLANNFITSAE